MDTKQFLPVLEWGPQYSRKTLRQDIIAGVTVSVMLVPQGMAYASLAGMPPIYGLYGGLLPLIIYAIFGTSRQLSIGPVAISALLMLAGVSQITDPGTDLYIQLVLITGLMIGLVQLVMSLLRMGFLVNFLSHPVIAGFTSAAAVIIAISQLKDVLGFSIPAMEQPFQTLFFAVSNLPQTQWLAAVMGFGSIVLMFVLQQINRNLPAALIVVALGITATWLFNLPDYGLLIVGEVPNGLPAFAIQEFDWNIIRELLPTVLIVTIIGFIESIGIAKALESKHRSYVVRPNQELMALGLSKIGGFFFQALPTSGSFTRSAINNEAGARTGVASIVAALLVAFTLVLLTPLFYYLPKAVLAAIVLMAVRSLFDWQEAVHLWKTHKQDFLMMLTTFVFTLTLGIEFGVFLGMAMSVLAILYRSSTPHIAVLGNLPGTSHYRNVNRFKEADNPEDLLIIRFDSQLYFGNASYFKESIRSLSWEKSDALRDVILDFSSVTDIDSTGLLAVEEVVESLRNQNIRVLFSGMLGPVRDLFAKTGLTEKFDKNNFFMRIHDAKQSVDKVKNGGSGSPWNSHAIQSNL